jgi:hypothetical protein
MTTLMPTSAAEAVANGAQLLDEKYPGWWRDVDPFQLQMSDCGKCVCGQLAALVYQDKPNWHLQQMYANFRSEVLGHDLLGDDEVRYGFFYGGFGSWTWTELASEWRKVIFARQETDALPPAGETVEQREEVLA